MKPIFAFVSEDEAFVWRDGIALRADHWTLESGTDTGATRLTHSGTYDPENDYEGMGCVPMELYELRSIILGDEESKKPRLPGELSIYSMCALMQEMRRRGVDAQHMMDGGWTIKIRPEELCL